MRLPMATILLVALALFVSFATFAQEKPLSQIHAGPICADLSADARKVRREFWITKSREFRQKMRDFSRGEKSRELINTANQLIERSDSIVAVYLKFATIDHLNSSLVFARRRMPEEFGSFDEAVNEELSFLMYSLKVVEVDGFERDLAEVNHAYLQAEAREYLRAAKAALDTTQRCVEMGREHDRRSAEERSRRN